MTNVKRNNRKTSPKKDEEVIMKSEHVEPSSDEQEEKVDEVQEQEEQPQETSIVNDYVHVDEFLQAVAPRYKLTSVHVAGFKAYMQGSHYQRTDADFVEHLHTYLGI